MKPPCIITKCLKYPVCKNKEYIECEELNIYFANQMKYNNHDNAGPYIYYSKFYPKLLKCLHKTMFPNLRRLIGMWKTWSRCNHPYTYKENIK